MKEYKTWTSPYGREAKYVWKWVEHIKTGHMWRGSPVETCNSCDNCDGGKCATCRDLYKVAVYGEPVPYYGHEGCYDYSEGLILGFGAFYDYNEAVRYFESFV